MVEELYFLLCMNFGLILCFIIHIIISYRTEKEDKADIRALQILNDSYSQRIVKQRETIENLTSENRALKHRISIIKNNLR